MQAIDTLDGIEEGVLDDDGKLLVSHLTIAKPWCINHSYVASK
jgi:hypothetical protein